MGCNCGSKTGTTYQVTFSNGTTKTYLSAYEAMQAATADPGGAQVKTIKPTS
jgi:hypothetical protein